MVRGFPNLRRLLSSMFYPRLIHLRGTSPRNVHPCDPSLDFGDPPGTRPALARNPTQATFSPFNAVSGVVLEVEEVDLLQDLLDVRQCVARFRRPARRRQRATRQ